MRYRYLIELNVINIDHVKSFLVQYSNKVRAPEAKSWFTSKKVLNWFLNNENLAVEVQGVDNWPASHSGWSTVPDWIRQAIDRGEKLYTITTDHDTEIQFDHIVDWLNWLYDSSVRDPNQEDQNYNRQLQDKKNAQKALKNLPKITVEQAIQHSDKWNKMLGKRAERIKYVTGVQVDMDLGDGFHMVKLESADACSAEGKALGHCVGGYGQRVEKGEIEIYSLRDKNNDSHATIEIQRLRVPPQNFDRVITQVKGKQNRPPVQKYSPYILKWLENSSIKGDPSDLHSIGIFRDEEKGYVSAINEAEEIFKNSKIRVRAYQTDRHQYYYIFDKKNLLIQFDASTYLDGMMIDTITYEQNEDYVQNYSKDIVEFLNQSDLLHSHQRGYPFEKIGIFSTLTHDNNSKWGSIAEVSKPIIEVGKNEIWSNFQYSYYLLDKKTGNTEAIFKPPITGRGSRGNYEGNLKITGSSDNFGMKLMTLLNKLKIKGNEFRGNLRQTIFSFGLLYVRGEWRHISESSKTEADLKNGKVYRYKPILLFTDKHGNSLGMAQLTSEHSKNIEKVVPPPEKSLKELGPLLMEFLNSSNYIISSSGVSQLVIQASEAGYFIENGKLFLVQDFEQKEEITRYKGNVWVREFDFDINRLTYKLYHNEKPIIRIITNKEENENISTTVLNNTHGYHLDMNFKDLDEIESFSARDGLSALIKLFNIKPNIALDLDELIKLHIWKNKKGEYEFISKNSDPAVRKISDKKFNVDKKFYFLKRGRDEWTLRTPDMPTYTNALKIELEGDNITRTSYNKTYLTRREAYEYIKQFMDVYHDYLDYLEENS